MSGFAAKVGKFRTIAMLRAEWTFKQSVIDMLEDVQRRRDQGGRMPYLTGFLQDSLVVSLRGSTGLAKGAYNFYGVVKAMSLGDVVRMEWRAGYAKAQEYGWGGHPGRFFVRGGSQKWMMFVRRNLEIAKEKYPL